MGHYHHGCRVVPHCEAVGEGSRQGVQISDPMNLHQSLGMEGGGEMGLIMGGEAASTYMTGTDSGGTHTHYGRLDMP
jgi:hypothetical protein